MEQQTERKYISCADTAKLLRAALKEAFPETKFSVRSKTYSGGASISVEYENGPSVTKADQVANQFAGADFDGMQDLKTYKEAMFNGERVHFGADFVFVNRNLSAETRERIARFLAEIYGVDFVSMNDYPEIGAGHHDWHSLVWQYSREHDFEDFCKPVQNLEVAA